MIEEFSNYLKSLNCSNYKITPYFQSELLIEFFMVLLSIKRNSFQDLLGTPHEVLSISSLPMLDHFIDAQSPFYKLAKEIQRNGFNIVIQDKIEQESGKIIYLSPGEFYEFFNNEENKNQARNGTNIFVEAYDNASFKGMGLDFVFLDLSKQGDFYQITIEKDSIVKVILIPLRANQED